MSPKFHDQETQIVDGDDHGEYGGPTENSVLALLSNVKKSKTSSRSKHTENSTMFRLQLSKTRQRKRLLKVTIAVSATVIIVSSLLVAGYLFRKSYYLAKSDNKVGVPQAAMTLAPSQKFESKIKIAGYTAGISQQFHAINLKTQLAELRKSKVRHRRSTRTTPTKRTRVRRRNSTKRSKIVAKTKAKVKRKKKKVSGNDLNKLLKDTGF